MGFDIILGITLTAMALGAVIFLTLWSRRIIERIHTRAPGSLREFQMDNNHGNDS